MSSSPSLAQYLRFNTDEVRRLEEELDQLDAAVRLKEQELERAVMMEQAMISLYRQRMRSFGDVEQVGEAAAHVQSKLPQRRWTSRRRVIVRDQPPEAGYTPDGWARVLGMIYTSFHKRYEAPRQSLLPTSGKAMIVLDPQVDSLMNLGWVTPGSKIWLMYWFDRNEQWRLLVRPPRLASGRVGVFASRSPNRPSPLGLTLATITDFDAAQRRISVDGVDLLDETPLVMLRRFQPQECFTDIRCGWLDETDRVENLFYDKNPGEKGESSQKFVMSAVPETVLEKLDYLNRNSELDIFEMLRVELERRPLRIGRRAPQVAIPHSDDAQTCWRVLGIGSYRVLYGVNLQSKTVVISNVLSGIRHDVLESDVTTDREVWEHERFLQKYG